VTTAPTPNKRRKWYLLALLAAVLASAGGILRVVFRDKFDDRTPPTVTLDGVDAEVAEAVRKGREAVVRSPRNATAWGEFGELLHAHVFHPEALECYAEAERLAADEPRWPYLQGMILFPDRPDEGLVKLRRATELAPKRPEVVRLRYAELLLSHGRLADAREQFESIRRSEVGQTAAATLGLARVALAENDPTECLKHAEGCRVSQHTRKAAHTLLAEAKLMAGDAAGAAQEAAVAEASPPDRPWPDPLMQAVNKRKVGEKARIRHATELADKNQNQEAADELRRLVKQYPASADGWQLLGYVLVLTNADAEATAALTRAVELQPAHPRAHFYLGILSHRNGDRAGAVKRFRDAIAAKPDYSLAYSNLGLVLKEDNKRAEAEQAFREAIRCQPNQHRAHAQLGELLVEDGKGEAARTHLEQAVKANPRDTRSAELLAKLSGKK
jgi:tetratricopeptide (TPR) repeat protein